MKHFLSVFIIFCLVFVIGVPVAATGFTLEDVPKAEATVFLAKTDFQLLDTAPEKGNIISFNVSDDRIALAIQDRSGYNRKYLCIYDLDGLFLQGYSFNTREFGMDFNGDCMLIYFDNEDMAVSLSAAGQAEEVHSIPYSINREYWKQHVYAQERIINGMEYRLQNGDGFLNNFSSPDYAQFVVKDSTGNERILYDNSAQRTANHVCAITFLALLFSACGITFIVTLRHGRNSSANA